MCDSSARQKCVAKCSCFIVQVQVQYSTVPVDYCSGCDAKKNAECVKKKKPTITNLKKRALQNQTEYCTFSTSN